MGGKFEEASTLGFVGVPNAVCSLQAMRLSITSGSTKYSKSTAKTNMTTSFLPRPLKAPEPGKLLLPTSCVGGGSGGTGLSAFEVETLATR